MVNEVYSEVAIKSNAQLLHRDLQWLSSLIKYRHNELAQIREINGFPELESLDDHQGPYAQFINEYGKEKSERVLIIVALAQILRSEQFQLFLREDKIRFKQFGGIVDTKRGIFVPTLKSVVSLLAGKDESLTAFYYTQLQQSKLFSQGIVRYESEHYFTLNDTFRLSEEYMKHLIMCEDLRADLDTTFPAKLLKSDYSWDELVLPVVTKEALERVVNWVLYGTEILEEQEKSKSNKISKGYPILFHGPPGTGKSMAAGVIGVQTGRPVYRIDLSQVSSKYIGETEKNLKIVFDRAQDKDWILFFDEADALFGKRTQVKDAHDKYANQEMSYLLQRVEEFAGVVILATNFSNNIDDAMTRRFQSKIYFPLPKQPEREALWSQAVPAEYSFANTVSVELLAKHFTLSGANIRNIMKQLVIMNKPKAQREFNATDIKKCIEIELVKEGKTI